MTSAAAPREALGVSEVFAHWSLDCDDEPALIEAEARCREAALQLVRRLSLGPADRPPEECDEAALAARLDVPDEWSDVAVRPELSDMVAMHTGDLRGETSVAEPREVVRTAMKDALDRRGWSPPGTDWAISGHLWYRPGSLLGWHTNTRVPGWRAYLSWAAEPGRSFFRYRDPATGEVHTSWDTGLDLRLFHVSTTDVLWHCVWSGTERHSFGFRLVDPARVSAADDVLVCVRGRLADVPDLPLPPGFGLRVMDPDAGTDVDRWLAVHNAAFDRNWGHENHHLAMVENPVVIVDRTYLAERDGVVVGTASIGRFRGNLEVGVGHYLAVHPSARGVGLATALCSARYLALGEVVEVAEAQTHAHRVGSLRAHFRCGFEPKVGADPWNSLDPTSGPLRDEADRRLVEAYAAWQAAA